MEQYNGSTRTVITHGSVAVKFAKEAEGRRCNLREAEMWRRYENHPERGSMLCPVLWCAQDGAVLIMRKVEPVGPGFSFKSLPDWDYQGPGDDGWPFEPKAEDWGMLNGRLVAVDYSLT